MGKSKSGYLLCLIGGIIQILIGLGIGTMGLITILFPQESNTVESSIIIGFVLMGIWMIITGIFAIIAGFQMKSEDSAIVKKWGIIAIIVALIGLTGNFLIIVGGVMGIIDSNKNNEEDNIPQPQ